MLRTPKIMTKAVSHHSTILERLSRTHLINRKAAAFAQDRRPPERLSGIYEIASRNSLRRSLRRCCISTSAAVSIPFLPGSGVGCCDWEGGSITYLFPEVLGVNSAASHVARHICCPRRAVVFKRRILSAAPGRIAAHLSGPRATWINENVRCVCPPCKFLA